LANPSLYNHRHGSRPWPPQITWGETNSLTNCSKADSSM
jgi:hypothetical protein